MADSTSRTIVVLATLTIVAWLLARGVTQLAAGAIATVPRVGGEAVGMTSERVDRAALGCAILTRNMFDSAGGPIPCEGPDVEEGPVVATPTGEPDVACDGSVRLVATYVEHDHEERRIAVIRDATGRSLLYLAGMAIGDQVVSEVAPERVELRRDEMTCTLALFDRAATATAPIAASAPVTPAIAGVRVVGDRVEVSSSTISRAIADPMAFAGTMRALPAAGGLRLAGIRRDHPLASLGIQSGDLVRRLDGAALDGPDAWLGAMGAIARPGRHTVEVDRAGRTVAIAVEVVP